MSTNILEKEMGNRHKRFRTEVLGKNQDELSSELGVSQSTISNYDRGQIPSRSYINFLVENGCNLHWYFTGVGEMVYKSVEYHLLKERLNNIDSNDLFISYLKDLEKITQKYLERV